MGTLLNRRRVMGVCEVSAKNYIQDGLLYMWDGIENAGWGVHTNDPTKMVELISKSPATIEQNVTWSSQLNAFDTSYTITGKGIATSANNKYVDIVFPFNFNKNEWTIEMIQTITTLRTTNICDAVCKVTPWSNVFETHHYGNTIRIKTSAVSEWNTGQSITTGANCWSVLKGTNNGVNLYKNGIWKKGQSNKNFNLGLITDHIGFTNSGHHGVIHAFRIYDRELTDVELQYNYNIDKKRFDL